MSKKRDLSRYLWNGLDTDTYEVIEIRPQDRQNAAIIMRNRNASDKYLWCVQFRGGGHYFETHQQVLDYCTSRKWL